MKKKNQKTKEYIWKHIILLFITFSLIGVTGCQQEPTSHSKTVIVPQSKSNAIEEEKSYDSELTGVVKSIDTLTNTITVLDTATKFDITLSYTGACDVVNRYNTIIAMSQIKLGEIVDIGYISEEKKAVKVHVSKNAWEYKGVDNLRINKSDKIMTIADNKYKYSETLFLSSGNDIITLLDINSKDEVTVKGIGGTIYSIQVTKGHGYIRIENYDDFIGGYLELGYDVITQVTDNMLFVMREGTYNLVMENGELRGDKRITVKKDKEITVDMGEFRIPPERIGGVEFAITPEGADLYINETKTDYSKPIELNYGEHNIRVSLNGYQDFTGILTVGNAFQPLEIALVPEQADPTKAPAITIEGDDDVVSGTEPDITEDEEEEEENTTGNNTENNTTQNNTTQNNTTKDNTNQENQNSETGTNNNTNKNTNKNTSNNTNNNTDGTNLTDTSDEKQSQTLPTKVTLDEEHTMTIQAPIGVEVYINGTYKGTTPVTMTKMIGNLTVTFCREGYVNQSHSVEVLDDEQDVYYSFPSLSKSNG